MMLNDLPLPQWQIPKQKRIEQQAPVDRRLRFVAPFRALSDQRLTPSDFKVLMALCAHANRAGLAWPSQAGIGELTGIARENVSRAVKRLIEFKYLRLVSKGNSYQKKASCYQILVVENAPDALEAIAIAADRTVDEDLTPPHLKPKEARMEDKPLSQEEGKQRSREVISKLRKKTTSKPVDNQQPCVTAESHSEQTLSDGSVTHQLTTASHQRGFEHSFTNSYTLVYQQLNAKICKRQVMLNENDQAAAAELLSLGVDPQEFAALVEADLEWRMGGGKPMPAGLAFYLPTFRKLMAP